MKRYLWLWRHLTLSGLFGLITLIVVWNVALARVQYVPVLFELAIMLPPLLWLAWGILKGDAVRHVYGILLALLYAMLGVWYAFTPQESFYGISMLLFSTLLYLGAWLGLKTLKDLAKQADKPTE